MKIRFTLLLLAILFLSSCAVNGKSKADRWHSLDSKMIDRTQELYKCGKFYKAVASQRKKQVEKDRYIKFSLLAQKLAVNLTPIDGEISLKERSRLDRSYDFDAHFEVTKLIKEIEKNPKGNLFRNTTTECLSTIKREELFASVDKLNDKIIK